MKTFSSKTPLTKEEKQTKAIYYLTVDSGGVIKEKHRELSFRHRKDPLSIYKCSRNYPFAAGVPSAAGNPVTAGYVQIYFSLLPESFLKDMERPRKRKRWIQKISGTMDFAREVLENAGGLTILFSKELCGMFKRDQELPYELYGVFLFSAKGQGKFNNFSISLPDEYGFLMTEDVIALIEPYLAGTESLVFTGRETEGAWKMEDYLFDEYGIVMRYENYPADNSIWIDLRGEEDKSYLNPSSKSEVYPVNQGRILKFLDTTVKSGYNTKVN